MGVFVAAAMAAAILLGSAADADPGPSLRWRSLDGADPAVLYGLAQAAVTACAVAPGIHWKRLQSHVPKSRDGTVASGVGSAFAAFTNEILLHGEIDVCREVLTLLGPRGRSWPDVIQELSR